MQSCSWDGKNGGLSSGAPFTAPLLHPCYTRVLIEILIDIIYTSKHSFQTLLWDINEGQKKEKVKLFMKYVSMKILFLKLNEQE